MKGLMVYLAVTVFAVIFSCTSNSSEEKKHMQELKREMNDLTKALHNVMTDQAANFKTDAEKLLNQIDERFEAYENNPVDLKEDARKAQQAAIEKLKVESSKLKEQLSRLKEDHSKEMEDLKKEMKHDLKEFSISVQDFFKDNVK